MSDLPLLNTSLLKVMIYSKNELVFMRNSSHLTLQIVINAWWASMDEDSMLPISCNNSRHAPLCQFYLHCRIEATGRLGIMCVICHHVLRHPSEHETS
jgi:hypothetical protein